MKPALLEALLASISCCVDVINHTLGGPVLLQALLPEKRYLYFPGLAKAVGSVPLRQRIQQLQPDVCLVGHT
jgi:hypothetical protein